MSFLVFFNLSFLYVFPALFVLGVLAAVFNKKWVYFDVGTVMFAAGVYFWIMLNLFAESVGIAARYTQTDLPFFNFWLCLVASVYIFTVYAIIGLIGSVVLRRSSKSLLRIAGAAIILSILTYIVTSNLPCNYSPITQCEVSLSIPV